MNWKSLAAFLVLVTMPYVALGTFTQGSSQPFEGSTPPSDKTVLWTRNTDRQTFVYNDSLAKWIGEVQRVTFDRNASNVSGFIRYGGNGVISDTTTDAEVGFYADGVMRLMKATTATSSPTGVNCTTYVYSDQAVVAKLIWGGSKNVWTPTADSTGGWIAPSARVVLSDTDVMSVNLVPAAAPTNPGNPVIEFYFREEVSP